MAQLDPHITEKDLEEHGYDTDQKMGKGGKIVVRPGVIIRMTRNLDKDKGFVNGAIAAVCDIPVDYNPTGRHQFISTAR